MGDSISAARVACTCPRGRGEPGLPEQPRWLGAAGEEAGAERMETGQRGGRSQPGAPGGQNEYCGP